MALTLGLLIPSLFVISLLWLVQQWRDNKNNHLPPGPFRWPLVGNLIQLARIDPKNFHIAFTKFAKSYGEIVFYRIGVVNAVVISGYDAVKSVLTRDDFLPKIVEHWTLQRTFGKPIGIVTAILPIWRPTRRFTVRHLRDFGFGRQAELQNLILRELDDISTTIDQVISEKNGLLNPGHLFNIPMINIIWATVSGTRFDHHDPAVQKLVEYITSYTKTILSGGLESAYPFLVDWMPSLTNHYKQAEINSKLQNFLWDLVNKHRELGTHKENPDNFIQVFLQNIDRTKDQDQSKDLDDQVFTEENLVSVLYDLFWAGSDTTSNSLQFAILWLSLHERVQDKMRQEINEVLGKDRFPTLADVDKLAYSRAVLLELNRRCCIVPIIPRMVTENVRCNDYIVPKGCTTLLNFYSVMMDEDFWGDPLTFRPERFLDSDGKIINSERVIIFSLGKRSCMGSTIAEASTFLTLTHLVKKYSFQVIPGEAPPSTDPLPGIVVTPRPYKVIVKSALS